MNDSGLPASGNYDLRFAIYDAGTVPGVIIAGPLTNRATVVSNGLFTLTLDFGAGVFTGPARWLEIGVRTNGAADYTTLAPRQAITPMPYAVMAGSASNLLGSLSASQLSGTAGTLSVTNLIVSGAIIGLGGAGLTNLPVVGSNNVSAGSLTLSSADLYWRSAAMMGNLEAGFHVNRFIWTNALGKVRDNHQLRVLLYGDGWNLDGLEDWVIWNLTNSLPVAGIFNGWSTTAMNYGGYPMWFQLVNSYNAQGADSLCLPDYVVMTNCSAQATLNPYLSITADVWQIDYIAAPDGGGFKVQTSLNNSPWTDVSGLTAISSVASSPTGACVRWTNPVPALTGVRLLATVPGTNRIVGLDWLNRTVTNGVVVQTYAHQGISWQSMTAVATNCQGPLLSSWAPDIILCPGAFASELMTVPALAQMFTNWAPQATVVVCGYWPRTAGDEATIDRASLRADCLNLQWGYFDAYPILGSYSLMQSLGFVSGDGVHLSAAGYQMYGNLLSAWLGLIEYSRSPVLQR